MTDRLADWLRAREPADAAARSSSLVRNVADILRAEDPVHALDLATGTGANLRYLMERLPPRQRWLAVDRSSELLGLQSDCTESWAAPRGHQVRCETRGFEVRGDRLEVHVECLHRDLGVLDDPAVFAGRHLVTASALLDLVSERWLRSLAARSAAVGAAALFALTYNGESSCDPVEAEDDLVRDLLNQHQKTDKGLGGPACGPEAVSTAARCFGDAGYEVRVEPADWDVGPSQRDLQWRLVDGWAGAAGELSPDLMPVIADWRQRRLAHINAGRSRIVVRHHDLAAWPRGLAGC